MALPPWADHRARIDGSEFERVIAEILSELGTSLPEFRVERQELIKAPDGRYRIDITIRFTQLGATFLVLVECKDHARPVEREDVQVLADKLRAAGAHKGMLFSTNGFQRGAIEYARSHGIALVRIIEGALTYETRGLPAGARPPVSPWANIPSFVGQLVSLADDGRVHISLVEQGRTSPLSEFLASA
jgi:restriction system protein